jgi:solute carrier family 35 protein
MWNDVNSVAIIVLGAFVAGSRDLSFELEGYATVLLSNIMTAIYLATIARLGT